ncbi:hypothetical protein [Xylocopilactobacillus apicola]|uniref:Lipoprotein n=1 Tax=Xylocopilactobacillus apicola TaxID=2932184 RepID=A0AAU9D5U8_9LACO|nr:hypothetical protein [Xylocopilactobacillus apicola]BDR59199.1 hypothetical protein XA3_16400 [Xylocopilactobacillus apicola]
MSINKIRMLILLAAAVLLTGCTQQKNIKSSSTNSKKVHDPKQENYDLAVKDKIKAGTYSYQETNEVYSGSSMNELQTSAGNFTIYGPELYTIVVDPQNLKKDLEGFRFIFDYRNNTDQPQNGIKAF